MKICVTADLHGFLPKIPPCDLLIIAGDVCPVTDHTVPRQRRWLLKEFSRWLANAAPHVIGVAGNHDFALEDETLARFLPWDYLLNETKRFHGFAVWGTPMAGIVGRGWAFMGHENYLAQVHQTIPRDADVVISHGPPFGVLDFSKMGHEHTGSPSLREQLIEIQPALAICGHIHEGYGMDRIGERTVVVNASHVTMQYEPINQPILLDLEKDPRGWRVRDAVQRS